MSAFCKLCCKLTCNSTSCKEIKPSHMAIFICKQQFTMSINRKIDGRKGNVSEETCFGTLLYEKKAQQAGHHTNVEIQTAWSQESPWAKTQSLQLLLREGNPNMWTDQAFCSKMVLFWFWETTSLSSIYNHMSNWKYEVGKINSRPQCV